MPQERAKRVFSMIGEDAGHDPKILEQFEPIHEGLQAYLAQREDEVKQQSESTAYS